MVVWVDDWQMQCCGKPFRVGSTVSWELQSADSERLTEILGEQRSVKLDARQEHHDFSDRDGFQTTALVESFVAVHCRFSHRPDGESSVMYPVPGTGVVTTVDQADGQAEHPDKQLRFIGYIVRLRTLT
ncbi:hypothetical protein JOL79_24940 [Microbispora sp. RL4-1S]|uniref:Uncharacterized protein n=1 Tax=Microbispora oryzae TaxID=2806554 RepID=A0A941AKB2_9ACTN|nr:DUF6578 domain-containing protein [Microbispora oryzae]MBP2707036.1 hypothetical protein [Microbispora oryzae]